MQSDDFSDDCSGENVNVEGHVAIDNGNSGEGDVSTFSMLGCNSAHIRLIHSHSRDLAKHLQAPQEVDLYSGK